MRRNLSLLGVLLTMVCWGDSLTIAPGNGTSTNVSVRLTGELDVIANPGSSGGGIVTLGNRFNAYTGITSNGCGTLVATALAADGTRSSIGASGPLMLGAGTFRYTGPAGATLSRSVANLFSGAQTNSAVIVDAASDFGFDGQWVQPTGAFIKRGAGTFTIHGAPNGATNYFGVTEDVKTSDRILGLSATSTNPSFPANGDSPSLGYAGFTISEGTVKIDGGVNLFGQRWGTRIGMKTALVDATPTLELAGGTNIFYGAFQVGTTLSGGTAVVRVTGGENTLVYDNSSDSKVLRIGGNAGALGKLEMTGGKLTVASDDMNFSVSAKDQFTSSIDISGGTLVVNRYLLIGWEAAAGETMTSDLVVSGDGFVDVSGGGKGIEIYNKYNAYMTFNVVVRDGGTIRTERFFRSYSTNPQAVGNLLVDGGIIWGSASNFIFGDGAAGKGFSREGVRVGTKGMILQTGDTLTLSVPMLATNTVENMESAGLTLRSSDTGSAVFLFTTNNSYAGPTRIQAKAQLKLSTGDLPTASEVICEAGSYLYLGDHPRTVKSLDMTGSCYYVVMPKAALTVTDSFTATAGGKIYLKDAGNAAWGTNLATPGVYTVLTVPVKDVDALRQFAAGSYTVGTGVTCRNWIETNETAGTAALKVDVFGAAEDRTITLEDGDVYDLGNQSFDLCPAAGQGYTLTLLTNSVLRATDLETDQTNDPSISVTFDGGTFAPVLSSGNSYMRNVAEWILGAGGATFDLTDACDNPAQAEDYLNIKGVFRHDPDLGETPDGGIHIKAGPVMLGGAFVCDFSGPIVVTDNGRLTAALSTNGVASSSANCRIEIAPSATFEQSSENTISVSDLTLGETDASEPAFLTVLNSSTVPAFAITNALTVLSSVQISARSSAFPDIARTTPTGTRTILVYNSAQTTIDVENFALNAADHPDVAAEFAIANYSDEAYPTCDKALVMTCTAKAEPYPIWTSVTGGGAWNTLANWTNTETIPNGTAAGAQFNPATSVDVGVTLPSEGVTLKTLILDGEAGKGYTLSGGTLTLEPYRLSTPTLTATSGAHTVSSLQIADSATVQTATNKAGNISSLAVTALTGAGAVSVNPTAGAGTVKLDTTGFTGTLTTGSGVTEVNDLSFATAASMLKTGASTFRYTGDNATIGGFQLNGSRATYFETDADIFALAPVATKGALIKAGTGKLTLGGTGTFAPTTGQGSGTDYKMHANGDAPLSNYYSLTVNEGTLAIGVTGDSSHAPTVTTSSTRPLAIGTPQMPKDAKSACLQLNNGKIEGDNITMSFYLTYSDVSGFPVLRYEQNGGVAKLSSYLRTAYKNGKKNARYEIEVNGGELDMGSHVYLNYESPSYANAVTNVFTVNGGTVNVATNFYANYGSSKMAPSFIRLNGGMLTVANNFDFMTASGSASVLDLNSNATFAAGRVIQTAATGGTFNFNGGTFVPLGTADGTSLAGISAVNVSTNGAVIDTSRVLGGTYTIAQALAHDARCGETTDGGLMKKGTGTLVLAVANTYTGTTRVEAGTLTLAADNAIPAAVEVAYDGTLDLGGATRTVPTLIRAPGFITNGTLAPNGIAVTGDLVDAADCPYIDGNLTLSSTTTLDLGLEETAEGPAFATAIPLASVTGTATFPASIKAAHAGNVKKFTLQVESGLLVAHPASGAMVIIIR